MSSANYTPEERAKAVGTALVLGDQRAAELVNIPRRTIASWRKDERFAHLRTVAQDQLAQAMWQGVVVALRATVEALNDPKSSLRDKALALGIMSDKALLLTGMATSRHEAAQSQGEDLFAQLTHEEQRDMVNLIDAELAEREEAQRRESDADVG